ncbi:2546_t:CDS:2, partial [Acaulospora morrowiae]
MVKSAILKITTTSAETGTTSNSYYVTYTMAIPNLTRTIVMSNTITSMASSHTKNKVMSVKLFLTTLIVLMKNLEWKRGKLFNAHPVGKNIRPHKSNSSLVERDYIYICPIGSYQCQDQDYCCPYDTACVGGDLCSQCGVNGVVCEDLICCFPGYAKKNPPKVKTPSHSEKTTYDSPTTFASPEEATTFTSLEETTTFTSLEVITSFSSEIDFNTSTDTNAKPTSKFPKSEVTTSVPNIDTATSMASFN